MTCIHIRRPRQAPQLGGSRMCERHHCWRYGCLNVNRGRGVFGRRQGRTRARGGGRWRRRRVGGTSIAITLAIGVSALCANFSFTLGRCETAPALSSDERWVDDGVVHGGGRLRLRRASCRRDLRAPSSLRLGDSSLAHPSTLLRLLLCRLLNRRRDRDGSRRGHRAHAALQQRRRRLLRTRVLVILYLAIPVSIHTRLARIPSLSAPRARFPFSRARGGGPSSRPRGLLLFAFITLSDALITLSTREVDTPVGTLAWLGDRLRFADKGGEEGEEVANGVLFGEAAVDQSFWF